MLHFWIGCRRDGAAAFHGVIPNVVVSASIETFTDEPKATPVVGGAQHVTHGRVLVSAARRDGHRRSEPVLTKSKTKRIYEPWVAVWDFSRSASARTQSGRNMTDGRLWRSARAK